MCLCTYHQVELLLSFSFLLCPFLPRASPAHCCAVGSSSMPEPDVHGLSLPGSLFHRTTVILRCGHSINHGCPQCQNLSGSLDFFNTNGIGITWLYIYLCTTWIQNDFSPIKISLTSKIKWSFTLGVLFTYWCCCLHTRHPVERPAEAWVLLTLLCPGAKSLTVPRTQVPHLYESGFGLPVG